MCALLQSAADAPEDYEHWCIVQIHQLDFTGPDCCWVYVTQEDEEGVYDENKTWVDLKYCFAYCQGCVDDGAEDEHFLLANLKNIPMKPRRKCIDEVAKFARLSKYTEAHPLFPKQIESSPQKSKPVASSAKTKPKCEVNHTTCSEFKVVDDPYYFSDKRKYAGATCKYSGCKSQSKQLIASRNVPVYVCEKFALEKVSDCTACKFVCHSCYTTHLESGRRRR